MGETNHLLESLAVRWWEAEMSEEPGAPGWDGVGDKARDDVRKRVGQLLLGEIRRSEMGFGDHAIAHAAHQTELRHDRAMFEGVHRLKNWWDSVGLDDPGLRFSSRLFGNANVGAFRLCNLLGAGRLSWDSIPAYVERWYVRASRPLPAELMANSTARLVVGDRIVAERHLADLLVPRPIERVFPPRQHFYVQLEFWEVPSRPERLWVHLEGAVWDEPE